MSFDFSLPEVFSKNWRKALRNEGIEESGGLPRRTSYQAPGGSPVPFVLTKTSVSGGQSNDLSKYPGFGGWSSKGLNTDPHLIKITGRLSGDYYIGDRDRLTTALDVATSDEKPGYLVLPFWGRFAVNIETWNIDESTSAQGGCDITISFTRVGQSTTERQKRISDTSLDEVVTTLQAASVDAFENSLTSENLSISALTTGFTNIKSSMLGVIGRIQAAQSVLNNLTNEAVGITNLIDQGIQSPRQFALAFFGCVTAITSGVIGVKSTVENLFSDTDETSPAGTARNIKNVALLFLSKYNYSMDELVPSTTKELSTKNAMVALYRQAAFAAAATLIPSVDTISADKVKSLYKLFVQLEDSLDGSDPDVHEAVVAVRIATASALQEKELFNELQVNLNIDQPLLALAQALGVTYDQLVELNPSADCQFFVNGAVTYV